nr:hypothetical protein [Tanacetum cinerariifolium]
MRVSFKKPNCLKRDILLGWDGAVKFTQKYITKVVKDVGEDEDFKSGLWVSATDYANANGGIVSSCFGDIKNFLNNGKKCIKIPDDSPGAVRRLLGPWIVLPTKKNRLEGDPRPEPRDPPSDGQVRIV